MQPGYVPLQPRCVSRHRPPLPPTEQDDFDKVVLTARAELDERAFTEEWKIGSTMTQDDAITYTLVGPLA